MDAGTMELILANRAFLLGAIARGYAEEPDNAFAGILVGEHAREEAGLMGGEGTEAIVAAHAALATRLAETGAVDEAAQEYVRVFVGPETLKADPWESVHLTGKRVLFQPNVLDVRDAYREAGFLPAKYRQVSDDFIGLECDFMAKLAQRALAAFQQSDEGACRTDLERSKAFLEGHILTWAGSFTQRVEEYYPGGFYAEFARFAELVFMRDAAVLDELIRGFGVSEWGGMRRSRL